MSFLFPLGMAALGALAPLVALYLLKQKRTEQVVPAAFLWTEAMEDLRASSLFQRFRAPLLFVLQAASVILCALAAAGASLDLDLGSKPRRLLVLLDRSASMQATDGGEGRTRFDAARDAALELVDGLRGEDEMMLVAFDRKSEVLQTFTTDGDRLRKVLAAVGPRDLPTRPAQAVETAVSFARQGRAWDVEIIVLSDGCTPEALPHVPFPVRYAALGTSGDNQGIAAVEVSRQGGEDAQCFVRIENGHDAPAKRTAVLRRGAEVLDARVVEMEPGADATAVFELPSSPGTAEMSVSLEGKDVLPADDRAHFLLRDEAPRTGFVVRAEPSVHFDPAKVQRLRPGLALVGVTLAEAEAALAAGTKVDFVCWDRTAPTRLWDVPAQMFIACLPPGAGLSDAGVMEDPVIIDWHRTHLVTSRCQFDDVLVHEAMRVAGHERSLPLIESTGGPLALLVPVPGRDVLVVAFDPSRSNLWLKLSWPLFLANSMNHLLAGAARDGEESHLPTGTAVTLDLRPPVAVTRPRGEPLTLAAESDDAALPPFAATDAGGIWRFRGADGRESLRAFVLADADEIRCAPRTELVTGSATVASDPSGFRRNALLRDPLLFAALGILLLEWALWCGRR
ncbi:MAG: hypothetical protein HMLKMBBP_01882 [Planctomycetes bacterium]|nr:hypothetical protein [Planctomycetota bacterium]